MTDWRLRKYYIDRYTNEIRGLDERGRPYKHLSPENLQRLNERYPEWSCRQQAAEDWETAHALVTARS